ncbi:MAG: hypothetical protein AAF961_16570 [Planctomycetota bacterium]
MRFSFRGMLLFVAMICLYCATWGPTKSRGSKDVAAYLTERNGGRPVSAEPIAPLLFRKGFVEIDASSKGPPQIVTTSSYYFWGLGHVFRLPIETTSSRDLDIPVDRVESQGLPIPVSIQKER